MNSKLDEVIQPEILNDSLYQKIQEIASNPIIRDILEIGSSSGIGSTKAFYEGMKSNSQARLFCLEISKPRFKELLLEYYLFNNVHCFNMSSVSLLDFLTGEEVFDFCVNNPSHLSGHFVDELLRWLLQDLEYIIREKIPENGIDFNRRVPCFVESVISTQYFISVITGHF